MRKFTFKSLLVTAALCLSTSAWAALEEVWSIDFTSIGANYANKTTVTIDAASPILSMGPISVNGEEIDNKFLLQTKTNWMFMVANGLYQYNSGGRSFGLADCKAGQIISIETTGGVPTVNTNVSLMSSEGTTSVFSVLADGAVKFNLARYCYIRTIKVEENVVSEDAKPTKYTLKYEDENGSELKSIQIDSYVGEIVTATSLDIASFFYNEQKYIYKSGNEEISLVEDPIQNVITLVFREAETYSYTVNSSLGTTIASGYNFEGETITYGYPQYQVSDGTLYSTSKNGNEWRKTFELTEDNQEVTVNYTATSTTGVVYHVENENIDGVNVLTANNANVRCSNAAAAWSPSDVVLTKLEKGTYKLVAQVFSPQSAGGNQTFKVGGVTINFITGNYNTTVCESEFMVTDNEDLVWSAGGGNRNGIDFVYVVKLSDELSPVTTTITDAGYATFSSTYAVDFSESGLTAYTATVNETEKTVILTSIVDGIVPANTGVVLKGAAGEYTGTITTTDATVDNDLIANNAEITSDGTIYVLNNGTNGIGFYPLTEGKTLAAGKAYLQLTSGAKGYSFVWNDGETTGIEENYEFGTMNSDAATFDLSGRKVANPAKGLYIKNGKKFIVK